MKEKQIDCFLRNVETLVSERALSKQSFCDMLKISRSSFVNWKSKASIPNGDIVSKIAEFFAVDPNWLIYGYIKNLPSNYDSTPAAVFERIYNLLLEETKIPNPDYHEVSEEDQVKIWKPVSNIISWFELHNWQFNRILPTYRQLRDLANHFNKPISYIADGINESIPDYIETYKVPKMEYDNYKKYEAHKTLIWSYDALYAPDKKYIAQLIKRLFRFRLITEGRDFDFDYNSKHPLETPRQKDPNISDEEYEEKKKEES